MFVYPVVLRATICMIIYMCLGSQARHSCDDHARLSSSGGSKQSSEVAHLSFQSSLKFQTRGTAFRTLRVSRAHFGSPANHHVSFFLSACGGAKSTHENPNGTAAA
mmetsp:Transcript_22109/g.35568  ORF Transcript_22109/g.35568 Transcript_22109/m.35568 type:complete len:106 (-) Transcript_22109:237-554(-)